MKTINDVKRFWENNPLFVGESKFKEGTLDFFEEQRKIILEDSFANSFPEKILIPKIDKETKILDLGRVLDCGTSIKK